MKKHTIIALSFILMTNVAYGQNIDLMMQAWYWDYFQPANFGNWVPQLTTKAVGLKNAGFKHIWLPPLSRSSTSNNISNGYNPKDLYDLGEYGPECAWGSRAELNTLISSFNAQGLNVVSDMIYNHRDGGKPERNDAVKYFITSNTNAVVYPSDRFLCALPLGSSNPGNNGAGDYYIKVKSKSNGYNSNQYRFKAVTSLVSNGTSVNETEPNGGGDCGQPFNNYTLGQTVDANLGDWSGCHTDEFKITLTPSNFNTSDDTLFIYLNNFNSGYSDHYIYGIWSASRNADIVNELEYFTYTNYNNLPSGQGAMNYNGFRPNDNTSNAGGITENFSWPEGTPLFFYDYDQNQTITQDVLNAWTKWQIQTVGIKGLRLDAVKHFSPTFVGNLLDYLHAQGTPPQLTVGEFFDYNTNDLNNWVNAVYAAMDPGNPINVRVFDFALRGALKAACDDGTYDVRNIFSSGIVDGVGGSPFNVVTFVDNHDIRKDGDGIQADADLAYAYLLTNNQVGSHCVFYPDYYGVQVGNTPLIDLEIPINNLVNLHKTYIFGSSQRRYLSESGSGYNQFFVPNGNNGAPDKTLIFQLKPNSTGKNVIVAINFSYNPLDMYQVISSEWGAGPGTTFEDELGFSNTQFTNITPSNEIHVLLPPRSYTVFVENTAAPLELVDFQAVEKEKHVALSWTTRQEKDLSSFVLERAENVAAEFKTIGTVQPSNTLNGDQYQFLDQNPPTGTQLYYRLKAVDHDGTFQYAPVKNISIDHDKFNIEIAPNPGKSSVLVVNTSTREPVTIKLIDMQGKVVWEATNDQNSLTYSIPLPSNIPDGTYQIIGINNQLTTYKIWVKN